jgi:hypothetical protein
MPEGETSVVAMTQAVGGPDAKIRGKDEIAAAAQQATHGGQCALSADVSELAW